MTSAPAEARPSDTRRGLASWFWLALLLAYTVGVHHGIGPSPARVSLHWYDPRGFLFGWMFLDPWIGGTLRAVATLVTPAAILALWIFASGRSAVARALALSCALATLLFAFYGVGAQFVWNFFGWRGSAVLAVTALCAGFAVAAPLLAASWLRLGWTLRVALYLPVCLAVMAFVRNATGTDPGLRFAISPWPAVPVFGLEVGAMFAAVWMLGAAIGVSGFALARGRFARASLRERFAIHGGMALGIALPAGLLLLGSSLEMFPFRMGARAPLALGLLSGLSILLLAGSGPGAERAARLRRRGRVLALGAALVLLPLVSGQALARRDYHVTRELRAQNIIDALQQYYQREFIYPDALEELVATGELASIPRPRIGFPGFENPQFRYQSFGTGYVLEFSAPRWVQCAYNPPWEDDEEFEDEEFEDEEDEEVDTENESLAATWSCPREPPELW